MNLSKRAFTHHLGFLGPQGMHWLTSMLRVTKQNEGFNFVVLVSESGSVSFTPTPVPKPGSTRVSVGFLKKGCDLNKPLTEGHLNFRYEVPVRLLNDRACVGKFTCYQIRFKVSDSNRFDEQSCQTLMTGYVGITSRPVLERFKEHERDARKGGGHLLHSVWWQLFDKCQNFHPVLQIAGVATTLDDVYTMEEQLVDEFTLAPKGLNVIRGGHAGIAQLHALALLANRQHTSIEDRDAALVTLETGGGGSRCTHYRKGHFRHLSASDKNVWVRPCWVNAEGAGV